MEAMRPARLLLATALALAVTWPARGETIYQATVRTDGAEVRCKPGTEPTVYVTHKLARGATVQVVEKLANGWLKIDPPRGAFSWVNIRALRPADGAPGVWVVAATDAPVPVLVGSPYKPGKPDVVGTMLARGAQVIAVGEPRPSDEADGSWLPILPPPGEFRYVREADVSGLGEASTAARTGPAGGAAGLPPVPDSTPKAPRPQSSEEVHVPAQGRAADVDPLLQQAEQLERSGDRLGAARLYDQLGNKYATSDHQAAVQYYSRAAWLRGGSAPAAAPRTVSEADALYQQARQYEQAGDWAEASKVYFRLGDMFKDRDYSLSMQYYNRAAWLRQARPPAPRATPTPPAATATPGTTAAAAAPPPSAVVQARAMSVQMVGPGVLARSTYPIDGRPTYVLESPQAQVIAYLTPQAGVDLEHYLGQNVEALGQLVPRADLHNKYMTVTKVRVLAPQP
jgi:hypothetical protein